MSLTLNAEQKSIEKIFYGKNKYIIPRFQRPYSWDIDQCIELYDDLKQAYLDKDKNGDDGYFLGNIVLASDNSDNYEVIDGQQRLTTLTIFMKALTFFDIKNENLVSAIWEKDGRTGEKIGARLSTKVFSDKDDKYLNSVLDCSDIDNCQLKKDSNRFQKNFIFFYKQIELFEKKYNKPKLLGFIDFVLEKASLLPIQTNGENKEVATERALKIFETINDRGKPLKASDIFKAKLYTKSLQDRKQEEFNEKWNELETECLELTQSIDDIFKFYSYISRGEKGKENQEIKLRDFFTRKDESPFNHKNSTQILDDLLMIVESIKLFNDVIENSYGEYGVITKWFQVIDEHSVHYPFTALIVFLFSIKNNVDNNENYKSLEEFCKDIIRLSYKKASANEMQYQFYNVMVKVMNNKKFSFYPDKISLYDFESFGILKKGYALLAFYLDEKQEAIYTYKLDKILNNRDIELLDKNWCDEIDFADYIDSIGNMIIIDFPKKNVVLHEKIKYFKKSNISEVKQLSNEISNWTYEKYLKRENILKDRLLEFFRKPDADN